MLDVEEAAGLGAVDDLVEGVGLSGERRSVEGDVACGEILELRTAASLVADVLIGAAVFLWRSSGRGSGWGGASDGGVRFEGGFRVGRKVGGGVEKREGSHDERECRQ